MSYGDVLGRIEIYANFDEDMEERVEEAFEGHGYNVVEIEVSYSMGVVYVNSRTYDSEQLKDILADNGIDAIECN